jgi:site-specific DNA-methyltransferase (adenine-specific)
MFGTHPAQKPVRLIRRMLMISAKTGDLCLVPFAGAGSECIAALESGLHFIGFETDDEYRDIALKRLAACYVHGQLSLDA